MLAFESRKSPVGDLLDHAQRQKIASELNAAILTSQCQEKDPKLPTMLKMLIWAQVLFEVDLESIGRKNAVSKNYRSCKCKVQLTLFTFAALNNKNKMQTLEVIQPIDIRRSRSRSALPTLDFDAIAAIFTPSPNLPSPKGIPEPSVSSRCMFYSANIGPLWRESFQSFRLDYYGTTVKTVLEKSTFWLNIVNPTIEELSTLQKAFQIHPVSVPVLISSFPLKTCMNITAPDRNAIFSQSTLLFK